MIQFRAASREDLLRYYDGTIPATMRAWLAEDESGVLGIAGVYYQHGQKVVFSDMTTRAEVFRVSIMKMARHVLSQISGTLYAVADPKRGTSRRFLERLGFVKVDYADHIFKRE